MKILFIPISPGIGLVSHLIPLVSLENKLPYNKHETAFLLPADFHSLAKELNLNVVNIDHHSSEEGFRAEILGCQKFKPDVIVDDCSMHTFFVKQIARKKRVAIQRTGMFPGAIPRNKNQVHSMGQNVNLKGFEIYKNFGLNIPKCFENFFDADMKIVPGIPAIEVLPDSLKNDPTYIFSGPLLLENIKLEKINSYFLDKSKKEGLYHPIEMETFFYDNQKRFIIYVTFGNVAQATVAVFDSIRYLLDNDVAVITNVKVSELSEKQKKIYFYSSFLPMDYVCPRVNMMIHHCGSGTYQYQILYELPSITIGTGCYDREDVAIRLEELGVNKHLPQPNECDDFVSLFKNTFESYGGSSGNMYLEAKRKLLALKEESEQVAKKFNFDDVLKQAVNK